MPRIGPFEANRHVRDRGHPVEIHENRDEALLGFPVAERALEETGLSVLAGGVEPDEVSTDDVSEQLVSLGVAVDDVFRRKGMRVDERVDVDDHDRLRDYQPCVFVTTRW
jgi:hypothetical protein